MTPLQKLKAGIEPKIDRHGHLDWVRDHSDEVLEQARATLGKENLKDLSNSLVRWKADRLAAIRYEIRRRAIQALAPA